MILETKKRKLGKLIKELYTQEVFTFYRSLLLEQISGKDFTDGIKKVAAAKGSVARSAVERDPSPSGEVARQIIDVGGSVPTSISNRVTPEREIDDKEIGRVLLQIFKQKRNQPDSSIQDMFSAQFGFNLPDGQLEMLDGEIADGIVGELEKALRGVQVAPEAPMEMTVPNLGQLFDAVRTGYTGLAPVGV
jgi:hypothetical protein